ncbi:MAG: hypothetical protein V1870_01215 [Candidatus Aenigmatarchaeota archaeon]
MKKIGGCWRKADIGNRPIYMTGLISAEMVEKYPDWGWSYIDKFTIKFLERIDAPVQRATIGGHTIIATEEGRTEIMIYLDTNTTEQLYTVFENNKLANYSTCDTQTEPPLKLLYALRNGRLPDEIKTIVDNLQI